MFNVWINRTLLSCQRVGDYSHTGIDKGQNILWSDYSLMTATLMLWAANCPCSLCELFSDTYFCMWIETVVPGMIFLSPLHQSKDPSGIQRDEIVNWDTGNLTAITKGSSGRCGTLHSNDVDSRLSLHEAATTTLVAHTALGSTSIFKRYGSYRRIQ